MDAETTAAIETAKRYLENHDPGLAAFVLRDLPEVERLGLRNLAWAMCRDDSYVHNNDVLYLIELLEKGNLK